jgi:hypothetical protein
MWIGDQLRQPPHDGALEMDVCVIARHDTRVHGRGGERKSYPRVGRRRVDPAEERRVAVSHGIRENVIERERGKLVELSAILRQRQLEKPLAQGLGERLPDGSRRELGEVIRDAVHEYVSRSAECLHIAVVHLKPILCGGQ